MKTIEMHKFTRDPREMLERKERGIDSSLSLLAGPDPAIVRILSVLITEGRSLAGFAAPVESPSKRVVRGLSVTAEAGALLFELAHRPGQLVEAAIDGRQLKLSLPSAHGAGEPSMWRTGFSAACATRHNAALSALNGVTPHVLDLSRNMARGDRYVFDWVPALQTLALRRRDAGAQLAKVLEGTKDDPSRVTSTEVRRRNAAEIMLAIRLHEGEPGKFNEALEQALLEHRKFWSVSPANPRDIDNRPEDPDGFLALGPLGLACLAHDRGIPIEVESPYIPSWIVRRAW
jgi:hypothetical protein